MMFRYLAFTLFAAISIFQGIHGFSTVSLSFQNLDTNIIYFSPNYDGSQDTVIMRPKTDESKKLDNWFVTFYNDQNKPVRTFKGKGNDENRTNFSLVFNQALSDKESVELPIIIEWDGLSDSGRILPEGKYYAILKTVDFTGFSQESGTNWIFMKYTAPKGNIAFDDMIFNPTPEGRKKSIHITQTLSAGDFWRAEIRDRDGNTVMRWNWGTNAPSELVWDGKNYKGSTLPEGTYDYILFGSDLAGNRTVLPVNGLNLSLKRYSLFLQIENQVFSPKADLKFNTTRIVPVVSDTNGILSWNFTIRDSGNSNIIETNGDVLPEMIIWNGRYTNNNIVPDGIYNSRIKITYMDDDTPESQDYPIVVDTIPPQIETKFESLPFSPDGDSKNDTLEIYPRLKDSAGIKAWKAVILDPDGRLFKSFSGMGRPADVIHWDGRSDNGELVQSASDYHLYISAIDNAGNIAANINAGIIPVDVLVEKTDRGLKIRINTIEFEFKKAELRSDKTPILDRVAQILQKYNDYDIRIEGHTDSVGSKKKNLELSKKRAIAVYQYLLKKGIKKSRMKAEGFGYLYPVASNKNEEGRKKNRRVEFILIKSK